MRIHLINPSDVSFGAAVITPRWLYVLAAATPRDYGDPQVIDETLEQIDLSTVSQGDVIGIGIHTLNALRGYEVGRAARERGAFVVYGGIHSSLFPDEPFEHGGAHAVVKGDGDRVWPVVLERLQDRHAAARLRRRQDRRRIDAAGALGSAAARQVHDRVGADRARLPEALLVLLGVAHRRPEAARARIGRGHRGARRAATAGIPLRGAGRRQFLSRHARRSADGRSPRRQVDLQPLEGDSRRAVRVDGSARRSCRPT